MYDESDAASAGSCLLRRHSPLLQYVNLGRSLFVLSLEAEQEILLHLELLLDVFIFLLGDAGSFAIKGALLLATAVAARRQEVWEGR